jgi:hypothetical protein
VYADAIKPEYNGMGRQSDLVSCPRVGKLTRKYDLAVALYERFALTGWLAISRNTQCYR